MAVDGCCCRREYHTPIIPCFLDVFDDVVAYNVLFLYFAEFDNVMNAACSSTLKV